MATTRCLCKAPLSSPLRPHQASPKQLSQQLARFHQSPRGLARQRQLLVQARKSPLFKELAERKKESQSSASAAPVAGKLEWQSPLSIIRYPDPRLRAVNARIQRFDSQLKHLSDEMFEVMYNGDDGVGLAAPQVGVNIRLMVFNPSGDRRAVNEQMVLVNPEIMEESGPRRDFEEGCLSFPQMFAVVERITRVKVKFQDLQGRTATMELDEFPARIFLHEFDHLQGTLFHDRMRPRELRQVKSQLVALEDAYLRQHPNARIQRA
ncbi:hypothetical protein WJX74_000642 [Apatococcus lobatus]|uniref:Peptide deformylase n=1 Tax=Apatococcus lobatus TaxID=904363 RepID=A0AAW1Q5S3_9CHLO